MDTVTKSFIDLARLVHLDLKGAPPKVNYYEQLFPLLRVLGATGLLVEYEDMFPYHGDLEVLAKPEAYSKDEIKRILTLAKEQDLMVIPLIQTSGHLEFVLKHQKFCEMREVERFPNAMCLSHSNASNLILQILNQVLELHPDIQWLHLGADEVWHLAECLRCEEKMKEMAWTKGYLFLNHMVTVVQNLQKHHPNVRLIMWDDMMRNLEEKVIRESEIAKFVEPMVWHYLPPDEFRLGKSFWEKYASIFPNIWIASAFKGATDMTQMLTPPSYHLLNHQAWLQLLTTELFTAFKCIRGIALTGWQRFDHFTVLCELLPVALPTLALCLQTIIHGQFNSEVHEKASKLLGFKELVPLELYPRPKPVVSTPEFPGGEIYVDVQHLTNIITEYQILMHHPRYSR
ncbi:hexosaminidase D-like isoform X1 [Tachypleus tridentatus]|uniref:hexosaminidase D-like isoform X1 n=2 Tax=Tachypleus tridentatus TaxID=6853 RepID=UPI003FD66007